MVVEAPVTENVQLVTQRWIEPIHMENEQGELEDKAAVVVDPNNANLSRKENLGSTDILIPPGTPEGSLVVALSPNVPATKDKPAEEDPLVQMFEVIITKDGSKALRLVPPTGSYLKEVRKHVQVELIDEKKKPGEAGVTRSLEPENSSAVILAQEKQIKDATLCQRLPSQSPYINLGLVTKADLTALRSEAVSAQLASLSQMPARAALAAL
jgi:hypothetical protein